MRRVLVVEDGNQKYAYIEGVLKGLSGITFRRATTIRSAFRLIKSHEWDVVLLDMTFEDAEGVLRQTRKEPLAGLDVLQFIDDNRSTASVLVLTQHNSFAISEEISLSKEELDKNLQRAFPRNYVGLVSAKLSKSDWLGLLRGLLGEAS